MHDTAAKFGRLFLEQYSPYVPTTTDKFLLEVGTGPDRTFYFLAERFGLKYMGIDQLHSDDPNEPYRINLPDESADLVISSSCFEHDEMFWVTYLEILRVLKPYGVFYMSSPSNGPYHGHPGDCYRFYRDSAKALEKWARKNKFNAKTLEHFIGSPSRDFAAWKDYVAVWVKDEKFAANYPVRIQDVNQEMEESWKL